MANLTKVIKVTLSDYQTLIGGGTITKGGVTYSYDANALYLVEGPTVNAVTALSTTSTGITASSLSGGILSLTSGTVATGVSTTAAVLKKP